MSEHFTYSSEFNSTEQFDELVGNIRDMLVNARMLASHRVYTLEVRLHTIGGRSVDKLLFSTKRSRPDEGTINECEKYKYRWE